MARAGPNQGTHTMLLNRTIINVKNDATAKVSKLTSRKHVHGNSRNISNIRNIKEEVRVPRLATERGVPSNWKIERSKRRQGVRIIRHMKRNSRIWKPWGCA